MEHHWSEIATAGFTSLAMTDTDWGEVSTPVLNYEGMH